MGHGPGYQALTGNLLSQTCLQQGFLVSLIQVASRGISDEEGAEPDQAGLFIYQLIYTQSLSIDGWKNKIVDTSIQNEFPLQGFCLRDRIRNSNNQTELKVEPLLIDIERSQLRWFKHLRDVSL